MSDIFNEVAQTALNFSDSAQMNALVVNHRHGLNKL